MDMKILPFDLQSEVTALKNFGLRVGQYVQVEVVSVFDNEALIKLNNQLLRTGGLTGESPGTVFRGIIEDISGNTILVKKIEFPPEQTSTRQLGGNFAETLGIAGDPELQQVVKELLQNNLPLDPYKIKNIINALKIVPPELRESWLKTRVWSETLNLDHPHKITHLVNFLLGDIPVWEDKLLAQELLNHASSSVPGGDNLYAYLLGREIFPGELYIISRRPKSKSIDPKDTTLAFRLETSYLGEIWFVVRIKDMLLNTNVYVSEQPILEFVRQELPGLQKILSQSGFKSVEVTAGLRKVRSVVELMEQKPEQLYNAIDIRV